MLQTIIIHDLFSQQQGFNYQAIARENGQVLSETEIILTSGLFKDGENGTLIWEETHSLTTSADGLFSIAIGTGTSTGNGSVSKFEDINWSEGNIYLKISLRKTNGGSEVSYPAELIRAVPYALHALSGGNGETIWAKDGDSIYFNQGSVGIGTSSPVGRLAVQQVDESGEEPLFMVTRKDGYPVFAVYEDGVYVYTDTAVSGKGVKGGFAVGGYSSASKGPARDYMRVTADSIRFYIDDDQSKRAKGGFAVGGYKSSKSGGNEIFRVTTDSTRITVADPEAGFSVGNTASGTEERLMQLTPENYLIGHQSGDSLTTGLFNSFFGYQAGKSTTTGSSNTFIGYLSGQYNSTGTDNLFLGSYSGLNNRIGSSNVFLGRFAGYSNIDGEANVFIGTDAGAASNSEFNVFIGSGSGTHAESASNVFVGGTTGPNVTTGGFNTLVGASAGLQMTTGAYNTILGAEAGRAATTGSSNTFLGTWAGDRANGNSNVFIGESTGDTNDGSVNVMIGAGSGSFSKGSRNIYIGHFSGRNATGSSNIIIGPSAGENLEADNTLIIENGYNPDPLIYGEFGNDKLVFNGSINYGVASGTDTYAVAVPTVSRYAEGMAYYIKFQNSNTGSATLNVNELGAVNIIKPDGSAIPTGTFHPGGIYMFIFDGFNFQLISN